MQTAPPRAAGSDFRRAARDTQNPVVGGVAGGLARHLDLPVMWVRVGFVVSLALGGLGAWIYAGLWLMLPPDTRFQQEAPGLESATRGGRRPRRGRRIGDAGPAIVLGVLGLGAVLTFEAIFGRGIIFWPIAIAAAGLALLWRQADEAQRERWRDTSEGLSPVRAVFGGGGWAAAARVGCGVALVLIAMVLILIRGDSMAAARDGLLAGLLAVVGLGIVLGPWVYRLATDLTDERAERVRTQERADLAAHLHDSVLQTLALIQKNPHDPAQVARLARSQERELRAWLYSDESTDESTLGSALRGAGVAVEDTHGISVDAVIVGDCAFTESLRPIVAATREALTNAAKHSQVPRVDVFAEVAADGIDVFVRDRGVGFDPEQIADDRHGVRDSIVDRMTRHGGTAEIRSAPGDGTEVRLHLPREEETDG